MEKKTRIMASTAHGEGASLPKGKKEPRASHRAHAQQPRSATAVDPEELNFLYLWTRAFFYAQDHPPSPWSNTRDRLHNEYLRRVYDIIRNAKAGKPWQQQARSALEAITLAEWLYPPEPRSSDKKFLVWFATHGHSVERASEIVNEIRRRRRHRPPSPEVRRESITDYDLYRSGKSVAFIADKTCGCGKSKHDRNCVEKIRQRIRQVKKLLGDYSLLDRPTE